MIHFTVYDLLWMFLYIHFLGWLFETVSASLKQKNSLTEVWLMDLFVFFME